MKIGLRGGHSPNYKGTIALIDEQESVRRLYFEVKRILEKYGHKVIDCNSDANTENGELSEGAKKANENNVDYFISLHMNAYNKKAYGTEAWTYSETSKANTIAKRLVNNYEKLGYTNRGVKYKSSFNEMRNINAPNIIFETLFCDNQEDVNRWTRIGLEKHAYAITNAIDPKIPLEPAINGPYISYQGYIQGLGWQDWKSNGEMAGTIGQAKRLEALAVVLHNSNAKIEIQGYCADIGWQTLRGNGEIIGTIGIGRRLEALRVKVNGLNVKYRVYVASSGWLDWKSNGEMAGTIGKSKRIEGVEIKVI